MSAALLASSVMAARPAQVAARCRATRPFHLAVKAPRRAVFYYNRLAVKAAVEEEAVLSDEEVVVEEGSEEEEVATAAPTTPEELQAWNAARLARLQAAEHQQGVSSQYSLNFLWLDKQIGVAVDQVFKKGQRSPVTEFFFWPRKDAWEELNVALQEKSWISESDRVALLNKCTEVINFWQDEETKHSIAEAQTKFNDCKFVGC